MKQNLVDGGNKQIVADLKSPKSPAQLQASLYTVIAQVKIAQVNKTIPNSQKLGAIDSAVSEVVRRNQTLPQGWQAAAALISYRGTAGAEPPPACRDIGRNLGVGNINGSTIKGIEFHNCTLSLDDPNNVAAINRMLSVMMPIETPKAVRLVNVHVL